MNPVAEKIDERILRLLGLEDTYDLNYELYWTLLREKILESSITGELTPEEEQLLIEEANRVKEEPKVPETVTKKISKESFSPVGIDRNKIFTAPQIDKKSFLQRKQPDQQTTDQTDQLDQQITDQQDQSIGFEESLQKIFEIFNSINESVGSISESLNGILTLEQKKSETQRLRLEEAENQELEEQKEESKGEPNKFIEKSAKNILSPIKKIWNSILKFLSFVFLGKALMGILGWLSDPKNREKITSVLRFVKDFWPVLLALYITPFKGFISKLIFKLGRLSLMMAAKIPGAGIAAGALGLWGLFDGIFTPPAGGGTLDEQKDSQGRLPGEPGYDPNTRGQYQPQQYQTGGFVTGPDGIDKVPAMLTAGEIVMNKEAVEGIGADFLLGLNKMFGGPQANKPKDGKFNKGGMVGPSRHEKALLKTISFAEGTTGSYGTIFGGKVIPELERGQMTVKEVYDMMMTGKVRGRDAGYAKGSYATGRYQFMPDTIRDVVEKYGDLRWGEKFTKEAQDRAILSRIANMRGVTNTLLKEKGLSNDVLDMLSSEFASFPTHSGSSAYGQPVKSQSKLRDVYEKNLKSIPAGPKIVGPKIVGPKKVGSGIPLFPDLTIQEIFSGKKKKKGGGIVSETTGMDIPGGTSDRQLTALEPGEYVLPAGTVDKLGIPLIDSIVSSTDYDSTPAKLGKTPVNRYTPTPLRGVNGGSMSTINLPPITQSIGGLNGGLPAGTGAPSFPANSPDGLEDRTINSELYGIVSR